MFEREQEQLPRIAPSSCAVTTRTLTMPRDTNANGDIFGGWMMSEVDIAGSFPAAQLSGGKVATRAVHRFLFLDALAVGEIVSCYAAVIHQGRTSLRVAVNVFAGAPDDQRKVAEAELTYVAIDEAGRPRRFT